MRNDKFKVLVDYSELMMDWDISLNDGLLPNSISSGSHIKVIWRCHKCGRIWTTTVKNRTMLNTGCTCDARERKIKSLQKTLVEKNGSLAEARPDLAAQWHPIKNGDLTPHDITCKSEYKVWWIDAEGNEWQSAVNVRNRNSNIPDVITKRLFVGKTDLATVRPELAAEWNYEKNEGLIPQDVMPNSKRRIWWKCFKGHEWQAWISSRTAGRGCPICNNERNTSFPEQAIYYYLAKIYPTAVSRYLAEKNLEVDIFVPEHCIGVEFDGSYYHKTAKKQKTDERKNTKLKELGIKLIRVVEENVPFPQNTENVVRYHVKKGTLVLDEAITEILNLVCSWTGTSYDFTVNLECDKTEIWEHYIDTEKENSIAIKKPELLAEWHPTKNGQLKPEYIQFGSNKRLWWKCLKCGCEWQATASNRTRGKGCPVCGGNLVVPGINDIATTHPNILIAWDSEKNKEISPKKYSAGSGKQIWWKCPVCGYGWKAAISNRTRGRGCPRCIGKILSEEKSLAVTNPKLEQEWHPTKNGTLRPQDVFAHSDKKAWWQCKNGHEWRTSVSRRTAGNECPFCGNKIILPGFNDLATTNPELLAAWDYEKNEIKPTEVFAGTNKKVYWFCEKGHSYQARIANRVNGNGCPYCAGKHPVKGENDLLTVAPALSAEWNYERNKSLSPEEFTSGSNKKVWWKCSKCGEEWEATICSRYIGRGCPYCAGKKAVPGKTDLATTNPELIKEWVYEKNGEVTPNTVMRGSRYKAWWKCKECNYEWQATVGSRSNGRCCPHCAHKK